MTLKLLNTRQNYAMLICTKTNYHLLNVSILLHAMFQFFQINIGMCLIKLKALIFGLCFWW